MKNLSEKAKKRIQITLRMILILTISLVFGLSIYSWNAKSLKGDVLPMPFKFGFAVVMSGSMEEELSVNDLIFIKETNDYQLNDVVVFQDQTSLVVHRIIAIDGDKIITMGDANETPDDPITVKHIKGEVVGKIPKVGLVVKAIKSPIGVVVILAAAIILLRLSYRKEKETGDDKLKELKDEIRKLKEEIKK